MRSHALATIFLLMQACGGDPPGSTAPDLPDPAVEITLRVPDRGVPGPGGTLQASIRARTSSGAAASVEGLQWSSSDTSIFTVDADGLVTGVSEGSALLTARLGELTASEGLWVGRDLTGEVALVGVTVLDFDGTPPRIDQTVLVAGTQIVAVGPRQDVPVPTGAHVVEASGRFLMAGLTDAHAHPRTEEDLLPYLANGVTTIINLGHPSMTPVIEWRDRVRSGDLIGPSIYTTGRILDGANPRGVASIVTTPEAGRTAVRNQISEGVDFIKVYNSLDVPTFNAIVQEAHQAGVPVIGHGVRAPGLPGILEAGMDAIAHGEEIFYTHFGSSVDATLIPSAVEAIAASGAWLMPNLSTFERVVLQWGNTGALTGWMNQPERLYLHPAHTANWLTFHGNAYANRQGSLRPVLSLLMSLTKALHEAGVPLLLSTDSPIIPGLYPGFSIHEDLRLLVESGLTRNEALEVGTVNGGRFLNGRGVEALPFGRVSEGYRADLVLLAEDPSIDLEHLKTPRGVMFRGRFLSRARLDQLLADLTRSFQ